MLSQLTRSPVLGVDMSGVALLRLDQAGGLAPGNKYYKLSDNLAAAQRQGCRRLVSFGGAWSNHLHALAAVGRERGIATVGIVRGDDGVGDTAMLADARAWGMEIVRVSRAEYRQRAQPDYLDQLGRRFAPCLVVPEGGANAAGARGCMAIAGLLKAAAPAVGRVVLPVGTGTTLAGLAAGLGPAWEVLGIAALKGATDLERRVEEALAACATGKVARWQILPDDHCGGFARVSAPLRDFILAFEQAQGIPLEPVYTGKMLFAVHRRLRSGEWGTNQPLVAIHTGGLQGRRGFAWLEPGAAANA